MSDMPRFTRACAFGKVNAVFALRTHPSDEDLARQINYGNERLRGKKELPNVYGDIKGMSSFALSPRQALSQVRRSLFSRENVFLHYRRSNVKILHMLFIGKDSITRRFVYMFAEAL